MIILRAVAAWSVLLASLFCPLVLLFILVNGDFSRELALAEKAIIVVAGFAALIKSSGKDLEIDIQRVRLAVGWLVVSLFLLLFTGLLKILLFEAWRGGSFSADSSKDLDVIVGTFWAAAFKPHGWFRWVLFGLFFVAYWCFAYGTSIFLFLLMPNLERSRRFFRFTAAR